MKEAILNVDAGELSPEKQQQILKGAATVFAEDGYEGASMSRIAGCAGVSKGTLYNYFEGKADLFAAWISDVCERKLATVFDGPAMEGPTEAALKGIGLRMLDMMMSEFGLTMYRLTISEASKFPELARVFYQCGPCRSIGFMAHWLEQQVEAGNLAIDDPEFAAEQFFNLCQSRIVLKRRLGLLTELDDASAHRVVDASVAMFLGMYGVAR